MSLSRDAWTKIAAGLVFQSLTYGTTVFTFTLLVMSWSDHFGISRTMVMTAISALALMLGFVSPFVGRLLDHHPVRVLVVWGLVLYGLGLLLTGLAQEFWQIVLVFAFCIGPALALAGPLSAQVLIGRTVEPARYGLATGLVVTGTSLGGVIFPPVMALLMDAVGWRETLILVGPVSAFVAALVVWPLARESGPRPGDSADQIAEKQSTESISAYRVLTDRRFWIAVAFLFPAMAAFASFQYHLGPYAAQLEVSITQTSMIVSLIAASMFVGKILFGHLSDRVDPLLLCMIATTGLCLGLGVLMWAQDAVMLTLASTVLGLASGSFLPLAAVTLRAYFGIAQLGRTLGLFTPFLTIAGGFGPLLAGSLFDMFDSYDLVFAVLVVGAASGIAIALTIHGMHRASLIST